MSNTTTKASLTAAAALLASSCAAPKYVKDDKGQVYEVVTTKENGVEKKHNRPLTPAEVKELEIAAGDSNVVNPVAEGGMGLNSPSPFEHSQLNDMRQRNILEQYQKMQAKQRAQAWDDAQAAQGPAKPDDYATQGRAEQAGGQDKRR